MIKILGTNIGEILVDIGLIKTKNVLITTLTGLVLSFIFIYAIGFFVTTIIGKKILDYGENLLTKLPFIRSFYSASKKLTDAIFSEKTAFKKVILVEFPKEGNYTFAFVTSEKKWQINGKNYLNIFIPTAPNPTSGWYLIVPEDKIIYLDLSVEDALKAIVSAGIVLPDNKNIFNLIKEYVQNIQKK
ncbi:MAG: DUF502 domain-containing protein [Candidatus Hydrothermales bacterium]